jgi:hypothetical protein
VPRLLLLLILLALLAGCSRDTDWYPPPAQRPSTGPAGPALKSFIAMSDPAANAHIVKDISPTLEGGAWRWTLQRPELRLYVTRAEHLTLVVDFALIAEPLAATGPVTLSVLVNGKLLGKQKFSTAGPQKLTLPVPAGMVQPDAVNQVAIELDKVWKSPNRGPLGMILVSAGFKE